MPLLGNNYQNEGWHCFKYLSKNITSHFIPAGLKEDFENIFSFQNTYNAASGLSSLAPSHRRRNSKVNAILLQTAFCKPTYLRQNSVPWPTLKEHSVHTVPKHNDTGWDMDSVYLQRTHTLIKDNNLLNYRVVRPGWKLMRYCLK